MATVPNETHDKLQLYKFTKILPLKVAQIVVQSRRGNKVTQEKNSKRAIEYIPPSSPNNLQWILYKEASLNFTNTLSFNLSIPDEPEVTYDIKKVLNGGVWDASGKILCIEISLRTNDGDRMTLEIWSVRIVPEGDPTMNSISTIYYRMSVMLKSTLSISRITPAYKMSRMQHKETYTISHKIYGGEPNTDLLGEKYKTIKVSDLRTSIGTTIIEVAYRTKMTILPEHKIKPPENVTTLSSNNMMLKSDHFIENPKKCYEKKEIDLKKPLTAGAFVDTVRIKELHDTLNQQMIPEPPLAWLLAEKDKLDKKLTKISSHNNAVLAGCSKQSDGELAQSSSKSKAVEVPLSKNGDKLMNFRFAEGSPIRDLAMFLEDCIQAKSNSGDWCEKISEVATTDSESLSQQLKTFEDAVPEFDNMVASMFSGSDNSDHS